MGITLSAASALWCQPDLRFGTRSKERCCRPRRRERLVASVYESDAELTRAPRTTRSPRTAQW